MAPVRGNRGCHDCDRVSKGEIGGKEAGEEKLFQPEGISFPQAKEAGHSHEVGWT